VKRALVLTALLAIAAVGGALAYRSAARDRSYRVLIASGEAALASGETLAAVEDFSGAIAIRPDAMLAWLRRGAPARTSKPRYRIEAANALIADGNRDVKMQEPSAVDVYDFRDEYVSDLANVIDLPAIARSGLEDALRRALLT